VATSFSDEKGTRTFWVASAGMMQCCARRHALAKVMV